MGRSPGGEPSLKKSRFGKPWLGFAVAVVGAALAALLRSGLGMMVGEDLPPYITFYPVILFSALFGGIVAGLFATALTTLTVAFVFLPPAGLWVAGYANLVGLALFCGINMAVSIIAGALHATKEEALRRAHEAEERERILGAMMENIPMGITLADAPDVRIRMVSRYGRELLAKGYEEIGGIPASEHPAKWEVYHADGLRLARSEELPLTRATQQGEIVRGEEWVVKRRDGTAIPILCTAAPIRDSQGEILGGVIGWQDLTERKRTEAALRESEQAFRTLADSIPNLAWWANSDGYITWYNRRWYEYTGTTPEQVEGWGWQNVHDPAMRSSVLERWKASVAGGEPFEMELPLRSADGRFRWFLTRGVPVRDQAGRVVRWFGTNTDIGEIREAREVLARSREELQRLVSERTAKLEETVRELQHFSYAITHDMRAPLRAMSGFIHILLSNQYAHSRDDSAVAMLTRVQSAAERMDALIRDALQYSKVLIEDFPLQQVNAKRMLQTIIETYPNLQRAEIRLEGEFPPVLGYEAALTQCFSNLLGNAVKFVPEGRQPRIRVYPERKRDYVRLWLEDNGIGIAPEHQGRIFEMFQKLHSEYEGTGIGLAIVKKSAERMGGRVGVESEPGKGSRFWLELKAVEPSAG